MGATRNTGYIENLIAYDGNNNIGVGGPVNVLYKVTIGGNTLISGNLNVTGTITFSSNVTANSFVKNGGVATEFLKADGTVDSSTYATVSYVDTSISNLIDAAPAALNTLNELAAALGDDSSFSTTVTTALGNRLRIDTDAQGLTSEQKANGRTNLGVVIGTDVQAYDADLGAIAALSGTSGFLKKTAANTWTLDTESYLSLSGGTLTGALIGTSATFSGDLTVDTNTLYVDSTNNKIGIGTTAPLYTLQINNLSIAGATVPNFDGIAIRSGSYLGTTAKTGFLLQGNIGDNTSRTIWMQYVIRDGSGGALAPSSLVFSQLTQENPTVETERFRLSSTGNGIFSGSLTATTGTFTQATATTVNVNATTNTSYSAFFHSENGVAKAYWEYINSAFATTARRNYLEAYNTVGGFAVYTNNTKALDINTSQAATFSGDLSVVESGNALLRVHASTNTTPVADIELMRGTNTTWGADAYGDYRLRSSGGNLLIQYGDGGVTTTPLTISSTGATTFSSSVTASSFVKSGGTSSQFLKADGSVDSTTYQTALTNPVTGTGTTNRIAYWNSVNSIAALDTASYPTLTELSYVKGVTSAIQTQINAITANYVTTNTTQEITVVKTFKSDDAAGLHFKNAAGTFVGALSTYKQWFSGGTSTDLALGAKANLYLFSNDGSNWAVKIDTNRDAIFASKVKIDGGTSSQFLKANGDLDTNTYLTSNFDVTGTVRARSARTTYRDNSTNPSTDAPIRSLTSTEDNWIYLDSASTEWGIYHRNIDTNLVVAGQQTLKANSIAFIGSNNLQAYICLADGEIFAKSFNTSGSVTIGGNTALHAGNYNSYALHSDTDSEQIVGLRNAWWNNGARRMNTDPRWNESGYDTDLGALHIWATTNAGANYGRAGIALYNGTDYQYLTTKASTSGMFVNNNAILHAGNYNSYALPLSGGYVDGVVGIGHNNSTPSGATGWNGSSVARLQSGSTGGNVYLEFRTRADVGDYAGLIFTDNNNGGYIAWRNYVGAGANDGTNGDYMLYGTYTDHIFQAGSSNNINGKPEVFRIFANGNIRAIGSSTAVSGIFTAGDSGASGQNTVVAIRVRGLSAYASLELGTEDNYTGVLRTYGNDMRYYAGHWRTVGNASSEDHSHYWYTSRNGSTDWSNVKMRLDHTGQLTLNYGPLVLDWTNAYLYIKSLNSGSGVQWHDQIWLGRYDRIQTAAQYPNFLPGVAYGIHITQTSDAAFFGLIDRGSAYNSYNCVIAWGDDAPEDVFQYRFNNNVIGTITPSGALTMSSDITAFSDIRIKENITTIDNALEKVLKLRGVYYNRTDLKFDKSKKVGFIAQEVQDVIPEIVTYDEQIDRYAVTYGNTVAILVEAIKEQQKQIEELKSQIKNK